MQVTLKKFRKKIGECACAERHRKIKPLWKMLIWGSWVKGTWEFFVLFLHIFCKSEKRVPDIQRLG